MTLSTSRPHHTAQDIADYPRWSAEKVLIEGASDILVDGGVISRMLDAHELETGVRPKPLLMYVLLNAALGQDRAPATDRRRAS